jgi:hypothetical protein
MMGLLPPMLLLLFATTTSSEAEHQKEWERYYKTPGSTRVEGVSSVIYAKTSWVLLDDDLCERAPAPIRIRIKFMMLSCW